MTYPNSWPWPPTGASSPPRDIACDDLLLVPPSVEPLDLEEVKKQRRFSTTSLDTRFDAWISSARQQFERQTGLQLITATRVFLMERFPVQPFIRFWRAPVRSVESIVYLDGNGGEQALDLATVEVYPPYVSKDVVNPGGVQLLTNGSWPTSLDRPGAVRIIYTAGFGDATGDVPELIKDYALMQYIGDFHRFTENQSEAEGFELPIGVAMVLRNCVGHMTPVTRLTRW